MGIREDIRPYIDTNVLVAGSRGAVSTQNGVMFTSEYLMILVKSGEYTQIDGVDYIHRIAPCITPQGMLNRTPQGGEQEGPDDYYALLNACKNIGYPEIPRMLLRVLIKYRGFLNNVEPGKTTGNSFLARQFQLIAAMVSAGYPSYTSVKDWLIRLLAFPLYFWTALVILTSCIGADPHDSDSRRLAWHLIENVKHTSVLCYLASIIWYKRLYNTYGALGMKAVARNYYEPGHPFNTYWRD